MAKWEPLNRNVLKNPETGLGGFFLPSSFQALQGKCRVGWLLE